MMVYYRFNAMTQGLKSVSGGALSAWGQTGKVAPRFVYKPILSADNAPQATSIALSSSEHGHGHEPAVPKGWENWRQWKNWKDVPDNLIPKTSPRDPDNLVYADQRYIDLRKQQIWHQIPDGKLVWQKMPLDAAFYYGIIVLLAISLSMAFYEHYKLIYKKFYPD